MEMKGGFGQRREIWSKEAIYEEQTGQEEEKKKRRRDERRDEGCSFGMSQRTGSMKTQVLKDQ